MTSHGSLDAKQDEIVLEWSEDGTAKVAFLTLNRPEQKNPIGMATLQALDSILQNLVEPPWPDAVVITGAGDAFSAGGDLKGYQELYADPDAFDAFLELFQGVCDLLESTGCLTVAMVNGTCVAGGLELALACDLIIMSDDATIGDGHLRFSQIPGGGGSQRLIRAIGHQRARLWLLSAKLFDAQIALDIGLAADVAPPAQLRDRTLAIIEGITSASPLALSEMKGLLRLWGQEALKDGLDREAMAAHAYATTSHDAVEGLSAFEERRQGRYLGR